MASQKMRDAMQVLAPHVAEGSVIHVREADSMRYHKFRKEGGIVIHSETHSPAQFCPIEGRDGYPD